ncbi:MAG: anti-sigma factor [Bacteroidota bacterium]
MMDKEYILKEGLLEKFLLDNLTPDEAKAVELAISEDIDLKKQFLQIEADFERMALENAIEPPAYVKDKLQKSLEKNPENESMPKTWLGLAAGLALLFALSTFWMYSKWQAAQSTLDTLQNQSVVMQERLDLLEENYELTNNRLQIINSPYTIPFVLAGNGKAKDSRAVAYVNHNNKLVVVNPRGLPVLPQNQTYQMWSDVNGEMINMGLLPTDKDLVTLKYIDHAESLNITIEPAGGNDHPTVEQLISYVTL